MKERFSKIALTTCIVSILGFVVMLGSIVRSAELSTNSRLVRVETELATLSLIITNNLKALEVRVKELEVVNAQKRTP